MLEKNSPNYAHVSRKYDDKDKDEDEDIYIYGIRF
jgi:hypothetical protein